MLIIVLLLNIHGTYSQNLTFTNITSPRIVPDFTTNYVDQYLGCKITKYTNQSTTSTSNYFITQQHQDAYDIIFRADAFNPTLHSILPPYGNYSIDAGYGDKTFAVTNIPSYDICTSPTTNDIILCYHRFDGKNTAITFNACTFFNRNTLSWTPIFDVSNATSYQQYPPKVLCLYDSYLIIWGGYVYNSANNISHNFQYTLLDLFGHIIKNNFGQTLIEYDINEFNAGFDVKILNETIMIQYITHITNNELSQSNLTVSFLKYSSIYDNTSLEYIGSKTIMENISNDPLSQYYSIYESISIDVTDDCCIIIPYATVNAQSNNVKFWLNFVNNKGIDVFNNEAIIVDEIVWLSAGSFDYHLIELEEKNINRRNNYTFDKYFIAVYSFWDNENIADAVGVNYRITYNIQNNEYTIKKMNTITLVEIIGEKVKTDCIRYFCMDYLVSEQFLMMGWNGCDHFYGETWEVQFPFYPHF